MEAISIETHQLSKTFNQGKRNAYAALSSINLSVARGKCLVLQGASGSGKTTLLTILGCLAKPTSGEFICLGRKVSKWSEKFLTQFRREHIGMIFQQFQLISGFTVFENIALPLIPCLHSAKILAQKVEQAAEQANITAKLHEKIDVLSGGEQQRVAIARAIVHQPTILLADEPTSNLDKENASQILTLFEYLKKKGATLVLTTHDSLVANHTLVDTIAQMQDGHLMSLLEK